MLCRYAIELPKDAAGLRGHLIPREDLANWEQAQQILTHANAQAEELLSQAEKKCEALLEEASLDIWQRADTQFKRWERDRQALCDSLEHYATSITHQAIRCLLDEAVAPKRLAALLKQLLANQVQQVDATLHCHPHDLEEINQHLEQYKSTVWKLQADETLAPQTLVLKTDEGDFRISWSSMLDLFLNHGKETRIDL